MISRFLKFFLARLNKQLDDKDQTRVTEAAKGKTLTDIVSGLISAIDPDKIEQEAKSLSGGAEPTEKQFNLTRDKLVSQAANVFTGPLINLLDGIRREKEQTIDHDNPDTIIDVGWGGEAQANAETLAKEFAAYLEENRDEIEALTIYYSQPARRSDVTYAMIKQVFDALKKDRPKLAPLRVWSAYAHLDKCKVKNRPSSELTALVALIRRVCGIDSIISLHSETVRKNFQNWIMKRHSGPGEKFTGEQMEWLRMIRDHIINSFHVERDDLERSPFDSKGGWAEIPWVAVFDPVVTTSAMRGHYVVYLFSADMQRLYLSLNQGITRRAAGRSSGGCRRSGG